MFLGTPMMVERVEHTARLANRRTEIERGLAAIGPDLQYRPQLGRFAGIACQRLAFHRIEEAFHVIRMEHQDSPALAWKLRRISARSSAR